MKDPNKAYYEEQAIEFLKKNIDKNMFVSYSIFEESQMLVGKMLSTCENLRKSRESWKKKYTELKNGTHKTSNSS